MQKEQKVIFLCTWKQVQSFLQQQDQSKKRAIDNVAFGKTTTWGYDNNGNILARYEYAITAKPTSELHLQNGACKLYTYDDNSDQLLSYGDEAFVYDTIGNPTTYRGKTATWAYGRHLTAFDGNTFAYDARGRRTAKNGITFTYDSNGNLIKQSNGLEFLYDHTGVFALKYNGSTYFYRKNAQNDIIALLDTNGATVVKYNYDAWGKCQTTVVNSNATEIAELNPFRYRSYYFDTETNLYFLKTRYYDPEIGRFMTIDDISYLDPESINGLNLYAYCGNNPVMGYDPNGTWDWNSFSKKVFGIAMGIGLLTIAVAGVILSAGAVLVPVLVGAGLGITFNIIGQGMGNLLNGKSFFDDLSFSSAIMAGLAGAAFATGLGGLGGAAIIGAMVNSGTAALQKKSWKQITLSAAVGAGSAAIGFGISRFIGNRVFAENDFTFSTFYDTTHLDAGIIRSIATSLKYSWYTFLPTISTGIARAISNYLGNREINRI